MLYSALEDFRVDILVGTGPGARTHSLPMPKFTAIGATTRQGLVSAPLRGRFGLVLRLDPYTTAELKTIVQRSAGLLDVEIEDGAAEEIARRCRGTPRIANRLLRRVRDYAQVRADGRITQPVAQTALEPAGSGPLRPRRDRPEDHADDSREIPRRTGGREHHRGLDFRRGRHHRRGLRAVPDPARLPQPHAARARGHRAGVRLFQGEARGPASDVQPRGCDRETVYLGLGSNIGDREANLRDALDRLSRPRLRVLRTSLPSTRPSRSITPTSAGFSTWWWRPKPTLFPMQLLSRIGKIERELGRVRTVPKGPRTIDIDILLYGSAVVRTATPGSAPSADGRAPLRAGAPGRPRSRTAPPADAPLRARDARRRASRKAPAVTLVVPGARPLRRIEALLGLRFVPPHAGAHRSEPDGGPRRGCRDAHRAAANRSATSFRHWSPGRPWW